MTRPIQLVLAVVVLLFVTVSPAAADQNIGLSRDGVTFTPTLPSPLFDPATRWVPGDTRTASFFVRNQADGPGILSVDILGTDVDSLLETGDLTISARGGGGAWRDVSTSGTNRLVSEVAIKAGEQSRVDVSVAFAPESLNQSQTKQLDLDFRVLLTQDTSGVTTGDETSAGDDTSRNTTNADDNGLLPDTGAPTLWAGILGLTFVALGITLVRNRQEKEDAHV